MTRSIHAIFNRFLAANTLTAYAGLMLFLAVAGSQSIGLYYVLSDLFRPGGYGQDPFSQLVAELEPYRERIGATDEVYLVKATPEENIDLIPLKISALQHAFAPHVIHGVVWRPSRPFKVATRHEVESGGISLQELHRFSDGGLVLCACRP